MHAMYFCEDVDSFSEHALRFTPGVGDVCSFAEMDVRKHGHPDVSNCCFFFFVFSLLHVYLSRQWQVEPLTHASRQEQAELGKTEMSLIQFSVSACAHFFPNPKCE